MISSLVCRFLLLFDFLVALLGVGVLGHRHLVFGVFRFPVRFGTLLRHELLNFVVALAVRFMVALVRQLFRIATLDRRLARLTVRGYRLAA